MNIALPRPRTTLGRIVAVSSAVAAAITIGLLGSQLDEFAAAASRARPPHSPDLELFFSQPFVLQVHILVALGAVGLGAAMMLSRKGQRFHRIAGWVWSALMMSVALSSLFIHEQSGGWSFLHLFAGWVLVFLPLAVWFARRHHVARHRVLMMVLFYGSLLVSGALTFLPGRLMWRLFFA
jgi:uncharacterized membrane protein